MNDFFIILVFVLKHELCYILNAHKSERRTRYDKN